LRSWLALVAFCVVICAALPAASQTNAPDDIVWKLVRNSADIATLQGFIAEFPESRHVAAAAEKIEALLDTGTAFDAGGPGNTPQAPLVDITPDQLVRRTQLGLRLAGCDTGFIDGRWGAGSAAALNRYAQRSSNPLASDEPNSELLATLEASYATECGRQSFTPADPRSLPDFELEATWVEEQTTRNSAGNRSTQKTRYIYRAALSGESIEDSVTVGFSSPQMRRFSGSLGQVGRDSANDLIGWSLDGNRLVRQRDRETYWTKTYFMLFEAGGALDCRLEVAVEVKPGEDLVIARSQGSGAAIEVLVATPVSSTCSVTFR
jgi:hypothetical protein